MENTISLTEDIEKLYNSVKRDIFPILSNIEEYSPITSDLMTKEWDSAKYASNYYKNQKQGSRSSDKIDWQFTEEDMNKLFSSCQTILWFIVHNILNQAAIKSEKVGASSALPRFIDIDEVENYYDYRNQYNNEIRQYELYIMNKIVFNVPYELVAKGASGHHSIIISLVIPLHKLCEITLDTLISKIELPILSEDNNSDIDNNSKTLVKQIESQTISYINTINFFASRKNLYSKS